MTTKPTKKEIRNKQRKNEMFDDLVALFAADEKLRSFLHKAWSNREDKMTSSALKSAWSVFLHKVLNSNMTAIAFSSEISKKKDEHQHTSTVCVAAYPTFVIGLTLLTLAGMGALVSMVIQPLYVAVLASNPTLSLAISIALVIVGAMALTLGTVHGIKAIHKSAKGRRMLTSIPEEARGNLNNIFMKVRPLNTPAHSDNGFRGTRAVEDEADVVGQPVEAVVQGYSVSQ